MFKKIMLATAMVALSVSVAEARDAIKVVGSSTVYPFTTIVAENFSRNEGFKAPVVESTGTGGGFKLFCAGVGTQYPDFNNASRAIKKGEVELCKKNGVTVTEIKVGYDGIVFANSKKAPQATIGLKEIFLALAKQIPDGKGGLIDNPYQTWSQINPNLPNIKIDVLGPPPTSGTRDAFVELAMEGGAKQIPELADLRKKDKKAFKGIAHSIREDGLFVEAGENDNLIVQKLESDETRFGIFGFSFLEENGDKIQGSIVEGAAPSFDSIADGSYPVSRPLFVYAKNEHFDSIVGMKEFVKLYVSDSMTGEYGALSDKGLIPLPEREKKTLTAAILEAVK